MANARNGNQLFIDSTGAGTTTRTVLKAIVYTPNASGDVITLTDGNGGTEKFSYKLASAETKQLKLDPPILFNNGIYVSARSASSKAYLTIEGGS